MNAKFFATSNEKELSGLLSCAGHLISSGQTFLEQPLSNLPRSMLLRTLRIDVLLRRLVLYSRRCSSCLQTSSQSYLSAHNWFLLTVAAGLVNRPSASVSLLTLTRASYPTSRCHVSCFLSHNYASTLQVRAALTKLSPRPSCFGKRL